MMSHHIGRHRAQAVATLALTLVLVDSCSSGPPPNAGPGWPMIYNSLEGAVQATAGVDTLLTYTRYPDLWTSVNIAYEEFAGINFAGSGQYEYMADPNWSISDPTLWPSPFGNDVFYQTYAANHRNTGYAFGIYFIGHIDQNDTLHFCPGSIGGEQYWGGVTVTPIGIGADNVPQDVTQRASFVTVRDGEAIVRTSVCAGSRVNYMSHAVAHELGHQRAGLTDNTSSTQPTYHTGQVPVNRADVMVPWTPFNNAVANEWTYDQVPMFDYVVPFTSNHGGSNCQTNLAYWRVITN